MLAQADFQRALALALGEFAPAWAIVGDCAPVDRFDASHWGSGPQSFQVTLRHRVTGHLKVLGRRVAYEPGATVHPAVALSLVGAYRHGNSEPIRTYLEEIGVAAGNGTRDANQFFRRPEVAPTSPAAITAEVRAAGLAVVAPVAAPRSATRGATSVVREINDVDSEVDGEPQRSGLRSWSLKPRWPALLTSSPRAPREVALPPPVTRLAPSARLPQAPEARTPMLGRLRRELQIWYWRRGAAGKDKPHARD
ncbi:MAG: hypothetical protein DMD87_10060 [Candidatus Rokuibacteriota bacterium]|nr:MAG: hypothetical protein DMD87_10060 [Candidatus Rokubacteria bacterium]